MGDSDEHREVGESAQIDKEREWSDTEERPEVERDERAKSRRSRMTKKGRKKAPVA